MTVHVLAFARVRELLGFGERDMDVPAGTTAGQAWKALTSGLAALDALAPATRLARNGTFVESAAELHDGDELALLPPVGGG